MKLLLNRAARITHIAVEIVEVSPAEARFLLSINAAEIVQETASKPTPKKKETRTKK